MQFKFPKWNQLPQQNTINVVTTSIQITEDSMLNEQHTREPYIREQLVTMLINKLYKTNYIAFDKTCDIYQKIQYSASIQIMDRKFSNSFIRTDKFEYSGEEFTIEELQKAVKHTFPERFI